MVYYNALYHWVGNFIPYIHLYKPQGPFFHCSTWSIPNLIQLCHSMRRLWIHGADGWTPSKDPSKARRGEHVECCLRLMTSNALMHLGWTKKGELMFVCFFLESCWITIWIGHLFVLVECWVLMVFLLFADGSSFFSSQAQWVMIVLQSHPLLQGKVSSEVSI